MPDFLPCPDAAQLRELGDLFYARRFQDMAARAQRLTENFPDSGHAWKALGTALQIQGKAGLAALERAADLLPGDAQLFNTLAAALLDAGQAGDAERACRQALSLHGGFPEARVNLGKALLEQGWYEAACVEYRAALELRPDFAPAHLGLAQAHQENGRLAQATAAYEAAIRSAPDLVEAYYGLAHLKTFDAESEAEVNALEALTGQSAFMAPEIRLRFCFALGKMREDLGRFDAAFEAYAEGNRLKFEALAPQGMDNEVAVARIVARFTPQSMRAASGAGHGSNVPVFIVGMPRSGTTLVEQILASHGQIHGAGEIPDLDDIVKEALSRAGVQAEGRDTADFSAMQWQGMGREYLRRLRRHAPQALHIIDKMPANFYHLGWIHLMLPNAKIIHVTRDAMDTCFSCYARLFAGDKQAFAYDLKTLGQYYLGYAELMEHWHALLPANAILDVRYEDVVEDVQAQAQRMLAYLGLPWDEGCLNFHQNRRQVKTASATQVRRPIYRGSLARWRNFCGPLQPLAEVFEQSSRLAREG